VQIQKDEMKFVPKVGTSSLHDFFCQITTAAHPGSGSLSGGERATWTKPSLARAFRGLSVGFPPSPMFFVLLAVEICPSWDRRSRLFLVGERVRTGRARERAQVRKKEKPSAWNSPDEM